MTTATKAFNAAAVREDFPILHQTVHGHPLVYLDNAASAQKPRAVIDAISQFYSSDYSNIHRGVHSLSERSTRRYEEARIKIQHFINAPSPREIIFVRGTTEAINLVAQTFGRKNVGRGDEILITALEHHSNIVPWQMLCEETGANLRIIPVDDRGDIGDFEVTDRTKLIAVAHISNVLGTILPVREIVRRANGVPVLVDGAQAVPHMKVDVQELGCDFYAFSSHKLYGPTGLGVLYGKAELLEKMPPYQGGGDMIASVTFEKTTYNTLPFKFEAGTPDIAGVIGLAAAIEYVEELGIENIAAYEMELLDYATRALSKVEGLRIIGTAKHKAATISFVMQGIHPHDVGTILDRQGIAVRTGHHCAQPLMDRFGVPATTRASLAFYNTREEIDALVRGLAKVKEIFD
ncbi:MAG TPA: cysteine desulfurase [Bryobacteraceae bacterium]|nr:cysteine desulfurase [Bryobacteraceae bacterium]